MSVKDKAARTGNEKMKSKVSIKRKISEQGNEIAKKAKVVVGEKNKKKNKKAGDAPKNAGLGKVAKISEEKVKPDKKEDRKKKKKLKEERQKKAKTEDVFQLSQDAKKIWEKVRRDDCDPKEKEELISKLYNAVNGNLKKVVFAHDTVRVLECLVSLGTIEIRDKLFNEAKEDLAQMIKSKYGHYFVEKLLKYGTKEQRKTLFKVFEGKVAELMKHKIANNVLENYYNEYANAAERNGMLQEFCGPEFRHFKEDEIRSVPDLIKKHPEKEKYIKRHLAEHVSTLITKGCYNHSLVHTILYNYMMISTGKERSDLIVQLRDVCLHVLHSHDGARLSMNCIFHGSNKDRKAIIKTFKTFCKKICMEEQGYLVMLAIFDQMDDTKFVNNAVLKEIIENLDEIATNDHGKKVLMHLLSPRNKTYFCPDVIGLLQAGDGNEHSKKNAEIRSSELRSYISKQICKYVLEHSNDMFYDNSATIFLTCVANFADHEAAEPVLSNLADEASKPFFKGDDEPNIVENTASHIMLKKVIAQDKVRNENEKKTFSQILLETIDQHGLESWIRCNRGAFLLVNMLETDIDTVKAEIESKIKGLTKTLSKQNSKGAELLKKKCKK